MYCDKCKKEIPNNAEFCPFCGTFSKTNTRQPKSKVSVKKIVITVLAVIVTSVLLCVGMYLITNNKDEPAIRENTMVDSLNEIKWYLTTEYNITDLSDCYFYEATTKLYDDTLVVVQLPSETDAVEEGRLLFFAYEAALEEGIGTVDDFIVSEKERSKIYVKGGNYYSVTLDGDDIGGISSTVYVQYTSSGQIKRLAIDESVIFEYQYTKKGQIEKYSHNIAQNTSWVDRETADNNLLSVELEKDADFQYTYNDDGSLKEVWVSCTEDNLPTETKKMLKEKTNDKWLSENGTFSWCYRTFQYLDGKRSSVSDCEVEVELFYKENGFLEKQYVKLHSSDESYYLYPTYEPDGTVEYSDEYDE